MRYQLLTSGKGVLIDRTPVLQDMRDTYTVSFLLPDTQPYIALFSGVDGIEHRKPIIDAKCKVPKELLSKEQYVGLTVCKLDGDKIVQVWKCEPLRITAFLHMRKTQWELAGGMTDKDCYNRLVELEKAHANTLGEFSVLRDFVTAHGMKTDKAIEDFGRMIEDIRTTIQALNENVQMLSDAYGEARALLPEED